MEQGMAYRSDVHQPPSFRVLLHCENSFPGAFVRHRKRKKPCPTIGTRLDILRYHPSWRMAPPLSAYFIRAAMVTGAGPVRGY